MFALRYFNDQYLSFDINVNIVDIASVDGVVAAVSDSGRLYELSMAKGSVHFKDITSTFSPKFAKMKSISSWRSKGRCLVVKCL